MTNRERQDQDAERASPDRRRAWIDSGGAGDKVPASDPAAAPLGTDDEAAGAAPPAADADTGSRPDPEIRAGNPQPPAGSAAVAKGATGGAARPWGTALTVVLACVAAVVAAVVLLP